jgi:NADPH:quinone reductase-like Zn-dependent oxidoreductase
VLIGARAAALNPVDYKIRAGALAGLLPTHFPLVSGFDVAGVVERVGPAVTGIAPGDEVIAYDRQDHLQYGSYAELVPAPPRRWRPGRPG